MRNKALLNIALTLCAVLSGSCLPAAGHGGDTGVDGECNARCSALDGEERYRCIRICINTKRKSGTAPVNKSKIKIARCEEECEDLTGLDRIKCIRICVEKSDTRNGGTRRTTTGEADPCVRRCGDFSGELRERCLLRCRRDNPSGSRTRPGDRKK